MRRVLVCRVLACIFLFVAPLVAQSHWAGGPPAAATNPTFEASLGFVYLSMPVPSQQRVGLTGFDANGLVRFLPRWGASVDGTYSSTGNVFNTGHGANILSLLAGPVFYPVNGRTGIFIHGLVGASRVGGAVPTSGPYYLGGWVARPSYAFGGGIEQRLFGSFAVRLQGDYQRTTFGDSTGAIRGQNNLRVITSMVYRFGGGRE
ncbi:MAG: hypothetical protein ACLPHP_02490 [Candidatus Sulfotelmatobacter sp.]